ncbi:MAG: PQQ-binding-like beta-propeller repeat protein [Candidatus Thorarchaeota archaeon]
MREKVAKTSVIIACILFSLIISVNAQIVMTSPENETAPTSFVFSDFTISNIEEPVDMCISQTGITFAITNRPPLTPSPTTSSLYAWSPDGTFLWNKTLSTHIQSLWSVATDDSNVYVLGDARGIPCLWKYTLQGNLVWNRTWIDEWSVCNDLVIADDGTIVINYGVVGITSFPYIIAFNTDGQQLWEKTFESSAHPVVDREFIYIACGKFLEKYNTTGHLIWRTNSTEGTKACVEGDFLYTMTIAYIGSSTIALGGWSAMNITRWNVLTGEVIWTHNIGLCDESNQVWECRKFEYTASRDGSLFLLINDKNYENWYLFNANPNGAITTNVLLLNSSWSAGIFEISDLGNVHVIGNRGAYTLTIAIFDLGLPTTPNLSLTDFELLGITVIGVALFTTGFIIYLKKKYPS